MAFRLKKTEVLTLKGQEEVRRVAMKLKGFGGTESEREDKDRRKRKIREKVINREATTFRWCVAHVLENGLRRRVNGQHSSEVFLELAHDEWPEVLFPVVVVWEEYECDTMMDLPVLFEQFDPVWSSRDAKDIMGAHLGIHEDLRLAVNRHLALKVGTALVWYRQAVEGQKVSSQAKYFIVHENHDTHGFMTWCGSFLQAKGGRSSNASKTKEMHHPQVLAAMYHTARDGDEEARGFWRRVASGKAPLDSDSVEYKLAEFLELVDDPEAEWPRAVAKHFRAGARKPSDLDVFATCLRAFYAWRKGTKVAEVFTPAKGRKAKEIVEEFAAVSKAA